MARRLPNFYWIVQFTDGELARVNNATGPRHAALQAETAARRRDASVVRRVKRTTGPHVAERTWRIR